MVLLRDALTCSKIESPPYVYAGARFKEILNIDLFSEQSVVLSICRFYAASLSSS